MKWAPLEVSSEASLWKPESLLEEKEVTWSMRQLKIQTLEKLSPRREVPWLGLTVDAKLERMQSQRLEGNPFPLTEQKPPVCKQTEAPLLEPTGAPLLELLSRLV